ncbi:MAG: hypothetical protein C5B55_03070 [Blastocatellia bacterium]|nr:MAG: hypothetical protein C5B55_03070 [Blastocatellia bacterium]
MRSLVLHIAVMMICFLSSVGLNRMLSKQSPPKAIEHQNCESTIVTAAPTSLPSTPTPVAIPTPKLIFDYDAAKFTPDGGYVIMGRKPKEFREVNSLGLALTEINRDGMSGYIDLDTETGDYQTTLFGFVTERRVVFETEPADGGPYSYRFEGEFLRKNLVYAADKNIAVLRGTLTKMKYGRTVAEHVFEFRLESDRC